MVKTSNCPYWSAARDDSLSPPNGSVDSSVRRREGNFEVMVMFQKCNVGHFRLPDLLVVVHSISLKWLWVFLLSGANVSSSDLGFPKVGLSPLGQEKPKKYIVHYLLWNSYNVHQCSITFVKLCSISYCSILNCIFVTALGRELHLPLCFFLAMPLLVYLPFGQDSGNPERITEWVWHYCSISGPLFCIDYFNNWLGSCSIPVGKAAQ